MRIRDLLDRTVARRRRSARQRDVVLGARRRRARAAARRGHRVRSRADLHDPRVLPPHPDRGRVRGAPAVRSDAGRRRGRVRRRVRVAAARAVRARVAGSRAARARTSSGAAPSTSCASCCSSARAPMHACAARLRSRRARSRSRGAARDARHAGAARAAAARRCRWKGKQRAGAPGWLDDDRRARSTMRTATRSCAASLACVRRHARATRASSYERVVEARRRTRRGRGAARRDPARCRSTRRSRAELLPHVIERIGTDKAEHGMFDYDDMLELVRDALHGPRGAELATRLRTRMPWVMIDEFQDTDPVQWDIFRTVWMHAEAQRPDDRRRSEAGDLRLPRRRRRDVHGRARRAAAQRRDARRRSTSTAARPQPLVDAVNADPRRHAADAAARQDDHVRPAGARRAATSRATSARAAGHGVPHAGRASATTNRDALARAIGAEIERLRATPPAWQSRGKRAAVLARPRAWC